MRKMIVLFCALLLLAGCGGSRPPAPKVTAGDVKIPVEAGSYAWKTFNRTVIADAPGPYDLVKDKEAAALQPADEIEIDFSREPKRLVLSRWEGNEAVEERQLDKRKFAAPDEAGEYVYGIQAEWGKNKSGTFAFKIKVE